jgi:hypothetical protein
MRTKNQWICTAPATTPTLHAQLGQYENRTSYTYRYAILWCTRINRYLTTESNGPCLNLLWNAKASGFASSPGPLMNPLDMKTRFHHTMVTECHKI